MNTPPLNLFANLVLSQVCLSSLIQNGARSPFSFFPVVSSVSKDRGHCLWREGEEGRRWGGCTPPSSTVYSYPGWKMSLLVGQNYEKVEKNEKEAKVKRPCEQQSPLNETEITYIQWRFFKVYRLDLDNLFRLPTQYRKAQSRALE